MPAPPYDDRTLRLSRRRLLAVGGAGAAALWLAPIGGVAQAAPLPRALKRSSWTGLVDSTLTASRDGRTVALRATAVSDLPVAGVLPALRGHDAAFMLRFSGPAGVSAGTYALRHEELGAFDLDIGPVADDGRYAAIVDRTVRVAGVNEEGEPVGVTVPTARDEQPTRAATAATAGGQAGGGTASTPAPRARAATGSATARARPRLRRLSVGVTTGRRSAVAELTVADLGATREVQALLLRRGRLVGRGTVAVRAGRPLRVRLTARRALPRGRHELVLALVDGDGRTTRIRRGVRLG